MDQINERLKGAAQEGNINSLYALIREDPFLLERIDQVPFLDTPLHTAAAAGHVHFVMEMMDLKPSFATKRNQDGFSPMHLALQNGHAEIVHRLIEIDSNLIRVKGREGITPLHYVAEKGDLNLLAEFLSNCPESIQDLTIRKETALHIAVKNNMFEVLEVLVGWLRRTVYKDARYLERKILNWKDDEGNTVLHIATSRNQLHVGRLLINRSVNTDATNLEGLTALDISESQTSKLDNREVRNLLCRNGALRASSLPSVTAPADCLRSKMSFWEKLGIITTRAKMHLPTADVGNLEVVVAVLILEATYQAGLSPPGGVWQDDYSPPILINTTSTLSEGSQAPHFAGQSVMEEEEWKLFTLYNTTALLLSVLTICLHIPPVPHVELLFGALTYLVGCYYLSLSVIRPYEFDDMANFLIINGFLLSMVAVAIFISVSRESHPLPKLLKKYRTILHRRMAALLSQSPSKP